jgi:hypothetical protein
MNGAIVNYTRRVVPRWRDLAQTISQKELLHPATKNALLPEADIGEIEKTWLRWKTEHAAGELIGASLLSGGGKHAVDAAEHILRRNSTASPIARRMALDLLNSTGREHPRSDSDDVNSSGKIAKIKYLRQTLTINPFDPYRWVELALQYTILGITEKADRALRTAYGLAREDQYVLRSLARFRLHTHSPDEALRVLVKSERLTSDPWLLATYFATADVAESKFRFLREAVRLNASTNVSNPSSTV